MPKSPLQVTCAIIVREGKVLAAQRSATMKHPLKWEFPGGKIEAGETAEACIVREIREELNVDVQVLSTVPSHSFPPVHPRIVLYPFVVEIRQGNIQLAEHVQVKWCGSGELKRLDWGGADVGIMEWAIQHLTLQP